MSLVSSAGIESEYAPFYTKEEATINMLINQVDAVFQNLTFDGIQIVDPLTKNTIEQIDQYYDLSIENSIIEINGALVDLSSQWRNLIVNPEEWVEVMADGDVWKVRVWNGYLQAYNTVTLPEDFRTVNNITITLDSLSSADPITLTPTQLSQATEITVNYYESYVHYNYDPNPIKKYYKPMTIKFPKSIGSYIYEAYVNETSYSLENGLKYKGADYDTYSK